MYTLYADKIKFASLHDQTTTKTNDYCTANILRNFSISFLASPLPYDHHIQVLYETFARTLVYI